MDNFAEIVDLVVLRYSFHASTSTVFLYQASPLTSTCGVKLFFVLWLELNLIIHNHMDFFKASEIIHGLELRPFLFSPQASSLGSGYRESANKEPECAVQAHKLREVFLSL